MSSPSRRPNLFIIGAPKCGTTTLWRVLSQHPEVFMCEPKEPHYFAFYLNNRACDNLHHYELLFRKADPRQHRIIGEASTWYYLHDDCIREILNYNPSAKIIFCVRDPVTFVASWHAQCLKMGIETVRNLEYAWQLQDARRRGKRLPPTCKDPVLLQYRQIARLGSRVLALQNIVPRNQLLVLSLGYLTQKPEECILQIQRFLDISTLTIPSLPHENPRMVPRSIIVQAGVTAFGYILVRLRRALGVRRPLGLYRRYVEDPIAKLNWRRPRDEQIASKEFLNYLALEFQEEIHLLSELAPSPIEPTKIS